ncbi:hypothetical protein JMJ76_0012617, partial [Colletotrichum scovillei]
FLFFPLLFSVCLEGRHGSHTTIAAQDQKRHRSQAPTRRSCTMTRDSIPSRSSHVRWNAPPQIREGWCGLLQVDRARLTSYMNGLTWSFFFNTAIPLNPAGASRSSIIIRLSLSMSDKRRTEPLGIHKQDDAKTTVAKLRQWPRLFKDEQ